MSETPQAYKVNFQPFKDIKPLVQVSRQGLILVGNPHLPAKNLKELVNALQEFDTLPSFLEHVALLTDNAEHFTRPEAKRDIRTAYALAIEARNSTHIQHGMAGNLQRLANEVETLTHADSPLARRSSQ